MMCQEMETLDRTDRRILNALQHDGRISNVALAERVHLSPSPCLRRVKALEHDGVIAGYRAILDREAVGLGLTIFVEIKVEGHSEKLASELEKAVARMPEVVSCHLVSGAADFLLKPISVGELQARVARALGVAMVQRRGC